jgi:hypothetical protein
MVRYHSPADSEPSDYLKWNDLYYGRPHMAKAEYMYVADKEYFYTVTLHGNRDVLFKRRSMVI